ncbi:hypothetical protein QMK17_25015 [Rhodococcus sp. G-MC3]|uniref:hypothetical protein n=1 Tax=Rhodococcus sp. G-MC3 TaxID=3046209 RepID=UPI0024B8F3C2|nr:hypothetical protein [Rhodococcus sp. G-MC3]MDJ0396567.1 hypothetical protein [Rhodococcus sp. G-MC3]
MKAAAAHPRRSAWSTAAVIVSIVAVGTVVAGLLNDPQSDAVAIPGCDEVVQPDETHRVNFAYAQSGSYDDPDHSWFSDAKAAAMSRALVEALPAGTTVEDDPFSTPLHFGQIANATASGTVSLGGERGDLTVSVRQSDEPPGPCFAGFVDERRTLDDGTVVDTLAGETRRRVVLYTDGSRIDAYADQVLTVEQLVDIATIRALRVSDPAPPAVPSAPGN